MLRACIWLLRRGGRLAFTTIHTRPDLTARQIERAIELGPSAVVERRDHVGLLRATGFVDPEHVDVTAAYVDTARAWYAHRETLSDELMELEGADAFRDRQRELLDRVSGVEEGLSGRSIFASRRPF